jgi:hypothetical protein
MNFFQKLKHKMNFIFVIFSIFKKLHQIDQYFMKNGLYNVHYI